ncbi:MAG: hypothetical protein IKZ58_05340 [Selenomonadaceae bacterium]|nr:hypothetical protein [Selenomonadaceae bacterium]
MNFTWDIVLQAAQDDLESGDLFFKPAESFSPYYEQSFKNINQRHIKNKDVEINPLYRFSSIFEYALHPDVRDLIFRNQQNFINYYFDLNIHILTEIDLCHGMTKREFYVRKIRQEMLDGIFGEPAREGIMQLKKDKQLAVADELLCVMETGSSVRSFCHIMKQIFKGCIIYQSIAHPQRLYVYIGRERDEQLQKQWRMIRETFLPIDIEVREFWANHFGIMDIDETMRIDAIAIF